MNEACVVGDAAKKNVAGKQYYKKVAASLLPWYSLLFDAQKLK